MKKLLIILFYFPILAFAQSSPHLLRSIISNSGSSVETINNNLVQQSIGQSSAVGLQQTSNHIIRQGFIHPTELKRMLDASNATDLFLDIYPNPTTDKITLVFNEVVKGNVTLSIYDEMGRLALQEKKKAQFNISLSLVSLSSGNYFIKVNIAAKEYVTQISKK